MRDAMPPSLKLERNYYTSIIVSLLLFVFFKILKTYSQFDHFHVSLLGNGSSCISYYYVDTPMFSLCR